ncbi:lysine--tRNA ligase [Vulcanimicrobium alpinum]|uniref:Lysine--tRNA ligase n=1 Tax=Vulcanimicrobium alpinum TaxID=3016050 RepID=A0AAN2CAQ3_UNVUL|nr:lysine--tRNA ligase [Vulcanimicrobium alpinum]BDE07604.1 lysine--tRNA ligase [Vulcanimicrobium alpinum]
MSESLVAARRARLAALRERGVDPFRATRFDVTAHAADLATRYADLGEQGRSEETDWSIAGRIMAARGQGKVIFFDLHDRTGRFQLFVRANDVGDDAFAIAKEVERGDIVGATGFVFRTKTGELSLHVRTFEVLGKSLQPLPDKWHGLTDVEKRYRRRYVDLIVNPPVRDVMIQRSRIVSEMRRFIDAQGFFEVETPTLLTIAGGATARPFLTHSNALDIPLKLRIATELYLKRLIVGGMERVYEIGRTFRNEGIDRTHNPEFTMLELYAAFWDVHDMMRFNEALMAHLARAVHGSEQFVFGEDAISFATPFRRLNYLAAFEEYAGITREQLLDPGACFALLREYGIPESPTHAHALDKLFERIVEPHLIEPTFVYGYPVVLSPLAKRMKDDPEITERYELFAAHMELSNAFTELNDPDDQRRRFELQLAERAAGDEEVPEPDWDFVRALEYGMPPTAGIGIGVDRLVMMLTNNGSIRDVLLFPLQRPLRADEPDDDGEDEP